MKFIQIKDDLDKDQLINLEGVTSIYANTKPTGGIFINYGTTAAIYAFKKISVEKMIQFLKDNGVNIVEINSEYYIDNKNN